MILTPTERPTFEGPVAATEVKVVLTLRRSLDLEHKAPINQQERLAIEVVAAKTVKEKRPTKRPKIQGKANDGSYNPKVAKF